MFKQIASAAAISAAVLLGAAQAASVQVITDPVVAATFTTFSNGGAGVQGAELRGGDGGGRATWEVGFGQQTSQPGTFVEAQRQWVETAAGQGFLFQIDASGAGTFQILDGGTATITQTWSVPALGLGNAIEFFVKRDAEMTITAINGMPFNFNIGDITNTTSEAFLIYSEDFLNGFTIEGTLGMINGRGSFRGIVMKAGNVEFAPVPVPAAGLLFAGAFGAAAMRRLRKEKA
ncbi:MAG: hypothetical protein HRU11_12065 [Parvularculaceae bacterium]|nr:hypothetical protein [Parvularculaceae bacterium]